MSQGPTSASIQSGTRPQKEQKRKQAQPGSCQRSLSPGQMRPGRGSRELGEFGRVCGRVGRQGPDTLGTGSGSDSSQAGPIGTSRKGDTGLLLTALGSGPGTHCT